MLDVTVLKTSHGGELEAKKLIPYVQSCDVFSVETAIMSEDRAAQLEKLWRSLLGKRIGRDDFSEGVKYLVAAETNPEIRKYMIKAYEYAFRNQRPLYCQERFQNEAKADIVHNLWNSGIRTFSEGIEAITRGEETKGVKSAYMGSRFLYSSRKGRDINIAKNLSRAEDIIRSTYPQTLDKDPLRLVLQIGAAHRPEAYSNLPIKVVTLVDHMSDRIDEMIEDGAPIDLFVPLFREIAARINK